MAGTPPPPGLWRAHSPTPAATPLLARAGATTKALLRPASDGGWELRLHTSYPFGADYLCEPRHAVSGWADAGHDAAWPEAWNRVDCPPLHWPDGTHDVALPLLP
ncbi:MAG: hypothetical protein OXI39_09585 [Gemmatimonadota bacterium]|uniref:hypothetical protein n=1 Tax=Candidatus Palauibacter scopulicola TaxID=3056741 RepID=UPI0023A212FA|nr:hypothetical protein [Candidatus Palauibacter scopulicola]MDE2663236.1 hypothetical protein [Candidatus Palauibacter scopulicola]